MLTSRRLLNVLTSDGLLTLPTLDQEPQKNVLLRNAANLVSILGVLPLCILFGEPRYEYLIPLIIYNNIMDDLDGVLAGKLDIRSKFGAMLDNVCDAISHPIIVFVIGMHYFQQANSSVMGSVCLAGSLLATAAIILRSVTRLDPASPTGTGSPTNELIRHILFVIILSQIFEFTPESYLTAVFVVHAVTMLVPFRMSYLIRSLTKSAFAIGLVNVALVLAWLVPYAAPVIAALFIGTYFLSFATGGINWLRSVGSKASS
jgi:phosphatidylserine synthase